MPGVSRWIAVGLACTWLAAAHAGADTPTLKLRIATPAPDGTLWASTFHKFKEEVNRDTGGKVEIRMYFGGIAGTETEVYELLKAGKLDGMVSGGPMCNRVIPSMRIFDMMGLFQHQEEATYILRELRPILDQEAHRAGFALLGTGSVGPVIMFSREPITNMAELRKAKLWIWDLKTEQRKHAAEMSLAVVPLSLTDAQKAFDTKRIDGFLTTPMAALAFQWYVGTRYITNLRAGYIMGCFLVRESALDRLPTEHQKVVRKAAARAGIKVDEDNLRVDDKLLGGTFQKRGLKLVAVSAKFRTEFFDSLRLTRERLGEQLVARETLDRVVRMLAVYRAQHER
jgi:TRAP-type transport system periplasmic protein